nr:MAG TPA: hypothetical protein [Caudoviricetes sp.]
MTLAKYNHSFDHPFTSLKYHLFLYLSYQNT